MDVMRSTTLIKVVLDENRGMLEVLKVDNFQQPFHRRDLEQSIHPVCPRVSWMSPTTMVTGQIAFKMSNWQVTWDI